MFRFHQKSSTRRGFTIVEIVIVVAVIGILAAILIPSFLNVQQEAELAELKANLNDAYTAFADREISSGRQVDPIDSYRFVRADGVTVTAGQATGLVNPGEEYRWDGKSEDVTTQDFDGLGSDILFEEKYGEFYIIQKRAR